MSFQPSQPFHITNKYLIILAYHNKNHHMCNYYNNYRLVNHTKNNELLNELKTVFE